MTKSKLTQPSTELGLQSSTTKSKSSTANNKIFNNKTFMEVIQKYNMRNTEDRLQDFRATLTEIVNVNQHDKAPRDMNELDPEYYGRKMAFTPEKVLQMERLNKSTPGLTPSKKSGYFGNQKKTIEMSFTLG